jgi:hypothetical protein
MKDEFAHLCTRLDKLENDIAVLTQSMNELRDTINGNVVPRCSKMDRHIDFVENVYDTVKSPLNYICGRVNRMMGGKPPSPKLE